MGQYLLNKLLGGGKDTMTIDAWNPNTFSAEIIATLTKYSSLIFDYHSEDRRLMNEHLNSSPYHSLKPNKYYSAYQNLHENTLVPILSKSRIRAWHYTRLTDEEVDIMHKQLGRVNTNNAILPS